MKSEEILVYFTSELATIAFAVIGSLKGYKRLSECRCDPEIETIVTGAMKEAFLGLQSEFEYPDEFLMFRYQQALNEASDELTQSVLDRICADPTKLLGRDERLVGPALLCRKYGIMPYYLAQIIAGVFYLKNYLKQFQMPDGFDADDLHACVRAYCQIGQEVELVQLIIDQHSRLMIGQISENAEHVRTIKAAYASGFLCEYTYKGCAQCTLAAFFPWTGKAEPALFRAASGFSGGMGILGDGCCGGYTGGALAMGQMAGRRWERMLDDGDKDEQFRSYAMVQKLHDRFISAYGSVICANIHQCIFGQSHSLKTKAGRDIFEAAGAHQDKCTSVVAAASAWIAEILLDEGIKITAD